MRKLRITVASLAFAVVVAVALSPARAAAPSPAPSGDLSSLDDEFENRAELGADWKVFHDEFGWPDKVRRLDVGATTPGALHLQPHHSAWVRDLVAPFLYREVDGDFDVRARVRVRGAASDIPGGTWSLGGLFARVPNGNRADGWEPRRENWNFITTGVGHVRGEPMTETKATFNGTSSLKLRPFPSGWVELRLVRVGMSMVALARADGERDWQVRDRWYRMEGSPRMQVGLVAYTTSDDVAPGPEDPVRINRSVDRDARTDMILEVDWIRFARPRLRSPSDWYARVSADPLADPGVTDTDVLRLLGD